MQEVLGEKGPKQASIPPATDFDDKLLNFVKLGEKLEPEINQLVIIRLIQSQAISNAFQLTKRYLAFGLGAKRPEGDIKDKLMAAFKTQLQSTVELEKSDKFRDHAKAMKQAGSAAFWVFVVNFVGNAVRTQNSN